MNEKERIGAKIAALREANNLTQEGLALKSGFTRSTISKIEKGKYNASIELVSRLVAPLGYRLDIIKGD